MKCKKCGYSKSKVFKTEDYPNMRKRRRRCLRCSHKWETIELVETDYEIKYSHKIVDNIKA